jgi:hypothetical protein
MEVMNRLPKQGQLVRVFPLGCETGCVARYFGVTYHSVEGNSHKWQQHDVCSWLPAAEPR